MLTKNSRSRNYLGVFEECLQSIATEIPVNKLIVVDAYSKDATLDTIKKYFANIRVIQSKALRGRAREIGVKAVTTPHFMFVDDDVILSPNWFNAAYSYFNDPKVGAVWGVDRLVRKGKLKSDVIMRSKVTKQTPDQIMIRNFKVRGGTHDILVKTSAVKNIRIPRDLHVYEDAFIKEYIERQGLKVVATNKAWCLHKRVKTNLSLKDRVFLAYLREKYGYVHRHTLLSALKNFATSIPKAVLIYLISKDSETAVENLRTYSMNVVACLKVKALGVKRVNRWELMKT